MEKYCYDSSVYYVYTYNRDGIRTSKRLLNLVKYDYVLDGDRVIAQTWLDNTMLFYYDQNGAPQSVRYNGTLYNYVLNLQGDVIQIRDTDGNLVVQYLYNAWGKVLKAVDADGNTVTSGVGYENPLRYRGYYYDWESGFYYLNSRYYDPEIGRFISPDDYVGAGQGLTSYNMYTYCNNNPVNTVDASGYWPKFISAIINEYTTVVNRARESIISYQTKIIESILTIKYDVPLYNQGETNLCWAYTQIMVEDYRLGIKRSESEARSRAIEVAKIVHGVDWDRASIPQNRGESVGGGSCFSLFLAIRKYGPLEASYGCYRDGKRVSGHSVVVTGVNVVKGIVYTNNPWGISGQQSYKEFIQNYVGGSGEGWMLDDCFRLY